MAGTKERTEGLLALVCESAEISGSNVFNSVEGIDVTSIQDRSTCYVRDIDAEYRWFEDSLAVPAPPVIVLPDQLTPGDPGRWIQITGGGGGGAVDSVNGTAGVTVAPTTGNVIVSGANLYARDGSNGAMTADVDMGTNALTNASTGAFSGAVTGLTFNGVALTTAGAATNYLDEQGNYTNPITAAGGPFLPLAGGTMSGNIDMGTNAITNGTYNGVALTTGGAATDFLNAQGNYVAVGGATPGAPDFSLQFNDGSGGFGGNAGLLFEADASGRRVVFESNATTATATGIRLNESAGSLAGSLLLDDDAAPANRSVTLNAVTGPLVMSATAGPLTATAAGNAFLTSTGANVDVSAAVDLGLTGAGAVVLQSTGSTVTAEADSFLGLVAGSQLTIDVGAVSWVWPTADGAANEVLTTDGSGNLSFAPVPSTTPAAPDRSIQFNNAGSFDGSASMTYVSDGSGNREIVMTSGDVGATDVGLRLRTALAGNAISGSVYLDDATNPADRTLDLGLYNGSQLTIKNDGAVVLSTVLDNVPSANLLFNDQLLMKAQAPGESVGVVFGGSIVAPTVDPKVFFGYTEGPGLLGLSNAGLWVGVDASFLLTNSDIPTTAPRSLRIIGAAGAATIDGTEIDIATGAGGAGGASGAFRLIVGATGGAGGTEYLRFNDSSTAPSAGDVLTWDGTQNSYAAPTTGGTNTMVVDNTAGPVVGTDPGANSRITYLLTLAAPRTFQLPAAPADGAIIVVKNAANTAAAIAVTVAGGANIDFAPSFNIATIAGSGTFQYEASTNQWWTI
jgi:hypothetical protein